jgi:hypothetical protein
VPPRALNPRISSGLGNIILKCLDKDPDTKRPKNSWLLCVACRLVLPAPRSQLPNILIRKGRQKWIAYSAAGVLALAAILIASNVAGWRDRLLGRSRTAQIRSVAVIPLENLSGDPAQEYFAEGDDRRPDHRFREDRCPAGHFTYVRNAIQRRTEPLQEIAKDLGLDAAF